MLSRWLRRIAIGAGAAIAVAATLVGVLGYDLWRQNEYKSVLQTLEFAGQGSKFILLTDIAGFEDRGWYVYELPGGAALTSHMKDGRDRTGVLFWNYSEAGEHYDHPSISLLQDRFLVFSRGGLYHSLYDVKARKVLVNDESPWHSFITSEQHRIYGDEAPPGMDGTGMDAWVRSNLHSKIERIVSAN